MTNSNLINLLSSPLDLDPVHFVQNYRTIDGEPFVIQGNGREYLIDFYRYLCIGAIKDRKPVIVVKGRQVEMTEAALNVSLYFLCNYKFFNVLHAFPTKDQVSRYSKERLQGAIRFGKDGKIDAMLADHKNASDTVSMVEFKNQNFYYMYSAWAEADSLRGLSVDALMRDEFQDWNDGAIANTDSSTTRSKNPVEFSFGTPKESGSPFEKLWDNSDKRYYHSRCVSCNKLFTITIENSTHKLFVKCAHCSFEQTKAEANKNGKWIATAPLTRTGRVGFHISQLIHPEIPIEDILRKKSEYSDSKFKNEVLGEFFTGGARPLTERDFIERCCLPYKDQDFPYMVAGPNETYMGIDWGGRNDTNNRGAFTVVTIISKNFVTGKYEVKYAEKLTSPEYLKQVARIKELITIYNSVSIVADSGYGQVQCQILQSEYGPRVKSAYYAPNSKNKMSYNEENWMLTIDRNAFIEEIIDIINRGNLIMPWKNAADKEWFVQQACNVEIKIAHKSGNVFKSYEKVDGREPNDALHSLNYAYIASIVHLGAGNLGRTPASSRNQQSIKGMMIGANFNGRPHKADRSTNMLFTREGMSRR